MNGQYATGSPTILRGDEEDRFLVLAADRVEVLLAVVGGELPLGEIDRAASVAGRLELVGQEPGDFAICGKLDRERRARRSAMAAPAPATRCPGACAVSCIPSAWAFVARELIGWTESWWRLRALYSGGRETCPGNGQRLCRFRTRCNTQRRHFFPGDFRSTACAA